jgi:hypothetical protein
MDMLVERVLASGLVCEWLVKQIQEPASTSELDATESRLGVLLPGALKALLGRWNGVNLDVVRFIPCEQLRHEPEGVYFANDPAGFMYFIQPSGEIAQLDTDGGNTEVVASDVEDFLSGFVFGPRAIDFAGPEWVRDLAQAGFAT